MKTDVEYCIRVAEACGFEYKTEPKMSGEKVNLRVRTPGAWRPFFPDVNYDSAFFALCGCGCGVQINRITPITEKSNFWRVWLYDGDPCIHNGVGDVQGWCEAKQDNESLPRAICEAILEMKKEQSNES